MCLCDNDYLCFYCEDFLQAEVKDLIKKYKYEILHYGDWFYGLPDYTINIHCLDDENFKKPNAIFNINIYRVGDNGMDDYSYWFDFNPITRKELEKA